MLTNCQGFRSFLNGPINALLNSILKQSRMQIKLRNGERGAYKIYLHIWTTGNVQAWD